MDDTGRRPAESWRSQYSGQAVCTRKSRAGVSRFCGNRNKRLNMKTNDIEAAKIWIQYIYTIHIAKKCNIFFYQCNEMSLCSVLFVAGCYWMSKVTSIIFIALISGKFLYHGTTVPRVKVIFVWIQLSLSTTTSDESERPLTLDHQCTANPTLNIYNVFLDELNGP